MVIDANLYWFPEELFHEEEKSEDFLREIPMEYGMKGSLNTLENGKKVYVIEKPVGSRNLDYVEGEYELEKQLADMEEAGVEKAVLKLSCQQEWMSLSMCRYFNTKMHAHVEASKGKLVGLGVVPPRGDQATKKEILRCLDELDMQGFQMSAHYGEKYLDDPAFADFFSYLNEVGEGRGGITIYVHHTPVPVDFSSLTDYDNLRRSYGRCVDQCTAIGREIFSGFFQKYPNIRLVHSMLGGGFFAFTSLWFPKKAKTEGVQRFQSSDVSPLELVKDQLFFEMSHAKPWGKAALECAVESLGAEHILFGSSYPVRKEWLTEGPDFVRSLDITEEEKDLILYKNAERLYGVK